MDFKEEEKPKVKVRGESPRKRKSAATVPVSIPPAPADVPDEEAVVQKKKLKRLERKITTNTGEKLSTEELMETSTYQRFTRLVENIFDATEDADLHAAADVDDDADVPQEAMIPKQQLHDMCAEAAKLKVVS